MTCHTPLKCSGIGRDEDSPRAAVIYFNRQPTDDELRFLHDCVKRWASLAKTST